MAKSEQRQVKNKVGGNSRQASNAEQATQIVEFSDIKGNLSQEVLIARKAEIKDALKEVLAAVEKLGLKKEEKVDLKAHSRTAKAQMKVREPNPGIVSSCFRNIWEILQKAAKTATTSVAGRLAKELGDKIINFTR